MTDLQTRVVAGTIFGILLIGSILLKEWAFPPLLVFIMITGLWEYSRMMKASGIAVNSLFIYLSNLLIFFACIYFPFSESALGISSTEILYFSAAFLALLFLLFAMELFHPHPNPAGNIGSSLLSVFYIGLPLGLLLLCSIDLTGRFDPARILFFFFFMWASDTGAYFTGRAFGKRKLLERLSPKKTVEGFIGGAITAMLTGIAAWYFIGGIPVWGWMLCGIFLSVSATLGDLVESMFKRQAGIKDSGNIMPGHGGILDRFDSAFLSAPVYFVILKIFTI